MGVVSIQRRDNRFASRISTTSSQINPNPNPNPNPNNTSGRRRRRKGTDHRSPSEEKLSPQRLVMGEVRILKRGEVLPPKKTEERKPPVNAPATAPAPTLRRKRRNNNNNTNTNKDLVGLCSTDRLGPEPETVCKQVKMLDLYAGAVTDVPSPAPSSLPFPPARLIKSAGGGCGRGEEGFVSAVGLLQRLLRI